MIEGEWRQGALQGRTRLWYLDGTPMRDVNFEGGVLHGEWRSWHLNGREHELGSYCLGKKVGRWLEYDQDGGVVKDEWHGPEPEGDSDARS